MPNNLVLNELKELIKNLDLGERENTNIEKLILKAKQNTASDTIKSALKSKILERKEKTSKSLAATKISSNYRKKMAIDEKYKSLGDYICTNLGRKEAYRVKLLEELKLRGSPNHIKNLYLYYCRFGAKSLGFEKQFLVKYITNSIFVNTGFKSTNFIGVHFKLCKFLKGDARHDIKVKNLVNRKASLKSSKKAGTYDSMEFENTKLENSIFEECDFYNVEFKILNCGSTLKGNYGHSDKIIQSTIFKKSKFNECLISLPFKLTSDGLTLDKYKMEFITNFDSVSGRGKINNNVLLFDKQKTTVAPKIIFEDTKFIDTKFVKLHTSPIATPALEYVYFINCDFECSRYSRNYTIIDITFDKVTFEKCNFKKVNFVNCRFKSCLFNNCDFKTCIFNSCVLCDNGVLMKKTSFTENTSFEKCLFSYHDRPEQQLYIEKDCIFNEVFFHQNSLCNFIFNKDIVNMSKSEAEKNTLNMNRCHFICNNLIGTNFDYCDLESSDFAARTNCVEEINWLGKCFSTLGKGNPRIRTGSSDLSMQIKTVIGGAFYRNFDLVNLNFINLGRYKGLYRLKNRNYTGIGYVNAEDFITRLNVKPWDYFILEDATIVYFMPPTSFNGANLKTCRFQSIDGFEGFDFTVVAKDSEGRPTLNACNFTNVDLTNSNMTNCNLIGSVFQVAKVTGVNFRDSTTNENTDFENTIDIGLALNADHINFGELQNNANETHSRAQFIINNREKYKTFYNKCLDRDRIRYITEDVDTGQIIIAYGQYINRIITDGSINANEKSRIKGSLANIIASGITDKVKLTNDQDIKLKQDLRSIINDEFIEILVSQKIPLQGGTQGKWCWFDIVLNSLLFLFNCPASYIYSFIEFYFNEIFNAHGAGGRSCTLGMIERLITIHSQVAERFIMTMDIEPTNSNITSIKHYNELRNDAIDDEITAEYIKEFNEPSKISPPNSCYGKLHKFSLNEFINLLKPNSTLPEEAEEDIGIVFDYTIKSEWREEFQEKAKTEVNSGNIETLDELCELFIFWMGDKIVLENGITAEIYEEIEKNGGKKLEVFQSKINELNKFLEENEIPNFKMAIIMMTSEEVTYEELVEYFEGGRKRRKKTIKKGRGLSPKVRTLSMNRIKSLSSRRIKSAPSKIGNSNKKNSKLLKLERIILNKFVNLPKDKVKKIFLEVCEPSMKFIPNNITIQDEVYRNILRNKINSIKETNAILFKNKDNLEKYMKNLKQMFPQKSKVKSPRKSISLRSRRSRNYSRSSRRLNRRPNRNRSLKISKVN